jgi:hypothetical protein
VVLAQRLAGGYGRHAGLDPDQDLGLERFLVCAEVSQNRDSYRFRPVIDDEISFEPTICMKAQELSIKTGKMTEI